MLHMSLEDQQNLHGHGNIHKSNVKYHIQIYTMCRLQLFLLFII